MKRLYTYQPTVNQSSTCYCCMLGLCSNTKTFAPYHPQNPKNSSPQYFIDDMPISGFQFNIWERSLKGGGGGNIASVNYAGNLGYMGIYPGSVATAQGNVMSTSQSISIRTASTSFKYHWQMANSLQSQGMQLRLQEYAPGYTLNHTNPASSNVNIGALYGSLYLNYAEATLLADMLNSGMGRIERGLPDWMADVNTGISAFNAANGLKSELIEYAVRSNYKSARTWSEFNNLRSSQQAWRATNTLGKTGASYLKYVKGLGYVGAGLTTAYSVTNAYNYYNNGGTDWTVYAKSGLDVIMTGVGFLGPIGFGISATYFILDASTGGFGLIKP